MKKNKLKKLINFYFSKSVLKKIYFKKIKKILKFSKNKYNFINYDLIFFFFKFCDINDLKNLIKIIKKLKIKIIYNLFEENYLLNEKINENFKINKEDKNQKNFFYKNQFFKKIKKIKKIDKKGINNKYKKIKNSNLDLSFFLNKFIEIKIFLLKSKKIFNKYIIKDTLIPFFKIYFNENIFLKKKKIKKKFNIIYNKFIEEENEKFIQINDDKEKELEEEKKINEDIKKKYIFFLKIIKINLKKKIFSKKILNELINLEYLNSKSINIIYKIFFKIIKKINKIKIKIYDILTNMSNISYIKFNFYFIKYGSNLNWIFNLINLKIFKKKIIIDFKRFIKKQSKIIKNIEKKMKIKLKNIIKIYLKIELNNSKKNFIRKTLIIENLYMVRNATNKYYEKDYYEDTIQEGVIGLINIVDKYEYNSDDNFYKLAYFSIRNSISKFLYSNRLIKLPSYIITLIRLVNKIVENYKLKYNKSPNIKYISEKISMPEKKLIKILNATNIPISLEKQINENTKLEEVVTDNNQLGTENILYNQELKKCFNKIFSKLGERYVRVLLMRYGMNNYAKETLQQIGYRFNLSKERIRQIQNIILNKLRHPERSKKLKKFFTPKFE